MSTTMAYTKGGMQVPLGVSVETMAHITRRRRAPATPTSDQLGTGNYIEQRGSRHG